MPAPSLMPFFVRFRPSALRVFGLVGAALLTCAGPGAALSQGLPGIDIPAAQGPYLPQLEVVEFSDTFEAGSIDNAVVFRIENTTAFPVVGLNLRPQMPAQYLILDRIEPQDIDLEAGEITEISAYFSVREDAEVGATDTIGFYFDTVSKTPLPLNRYRLIAEITEGEKQAAAAKCNSAVDSGGDEGGGVTVDLGGFVGKAGFTWEMYNVKDQMNVTVGGQTMTTGCVSGSGTFAIDIPPGATTARVDVVPNCEGTTGTQWVLKFECPLESEVTSDGSGNEVASSDNGSGTSGTGTSSGITTGAGQASPYSGATGSTTGLVPPVAPAQGADAEPNNTEALATPIAIAAVIQGLIETAGDVDIYLVDASEGGELSLSITLNTPTNSLSLGVRPALGGNWLPDRTPKGDGQIVVDLPGPGKYLIEVKDPSAKQGNAPYGISSAFRPSPDRHEPNDGDGIAVFSPLNGTLVGAIMPAGDQDYFRVNATRPGQWTIAINGQPAGFKTGLGVYPAGGGNWLPDRSDKGEGELVVDLPWAGEYLLKVTEANGQRSADPYVLGLSFIPADDGGEPNNSAAVATPIAGSGPITGTILTAGDEDFYLVDVPDQGEWTIAIAGAPQGMTVGLGVHPAGGGNWLPDRSDRGDGQLVVDLPAAGKYILRVKDDNGGRSIAPYHLDLTFKPTGDKYEPNHNAAIAPPIPADGAISGTILPAGDADFYLVDVPDQGEWTIAITGAPQGMAVGLGVHPAAGGNWLPDRSDKGDGKLVVDLPAAGKYVLRVQDDNGGRSIDPYGLALSFRPTGDKYEPNGNAATAKPIAPDGHIGGAILPVGDQDFYVVDVPDGGEWTIRTDHPVAGITLGFGVHPAAGGNWLPDLSPKGDGQLVVDLPAAGRYILRIIDGVGGRSVERYDVTTSFRPTGDTGEPNPNAAMATPIPASGRISGTILPTGDQDYFIFDAPQGGRFSAVIANQPQGFSLGLGVHPAGGGNWLGDTSPKGDGQLVVDLPGPGRYILRIIDGNGGRSPQAYSVTTSLQ